MLIGFIGAPGCGKTTTAFGLCSLLKKSRYPTEFVAEYARRHIMECRIKGIEKNGGYAGQEIIYSQDSHNAWLYRNHSGCVTVTDGCTINCSFYSDFNHLDLAEEAQKYDLLFYIPMLKGIPFVADANRFQDSAEILALAAKWEEIVRPLMARIPHIAELKGYPDVTPDQMAENAFTVFQSLFSSEQIAA